MPAQRPAYAKIRTRQNPFAAMAMAMFRRLNAAIAKFKPPRPDEQEKTIRLVTLIVDSRRFLSKFTVASACCANRKPEPCASESGVKATQKKASPDDEAFPCGVGEVVVGVTVAR